MIAYFSVTDNDGLTIDIIVYRLPQANYIAVMFQEWFFNYILHFIAEIHW